MIKENKNSSILDSTKKNQLIENPNDIINIKNIKESVDLTHKTEESLNEMDEEDENYLNALLRSRAGKRSK